MWNFGASPAKDPQASAGKVGGNLQAPPPDKPKDWKALGVLQFKDSGGVFEFRVVTAAEMPKELREDLHSQHGIAAVSWENK